MRRAVRAHHRTADPAAHPASGSRTARGSPLVGQTGTGSRPTPLRAPAVPRVAEVGLQRSGTRRVHRPPGGAAMTLGAAPGGPIDPTILQGQGVSVSGTHLAKLAAKLVRVMGAIGHIPKRGRNEFFGYDYATEADVADAVRTALVAEGVVMIPSIIDVKEREVL